MKNTTFVLLIVIIILGVILIFQSTRLTKIRSGANELFVKKQCIIIDDFPKTYVTKKESGDDVFIKFMDDNGWGYLEAEQYGAMYCFEKNGERKYYLCQYHNNYAWWTEEAIRQQ